MPVDIMNYSLTMLLNVAELKTKFQLKWKLYLNFGEYVSD